MSMMTLAGCCYDCGCRDCGCHDCEPIEKKMINVEGDAIIINGDNNDATMIKGNGNNSANRSSGNQNVAPRPVRKPVKPIVKPDPVKPEPKPEPEPEENCVTTTKTTHTRVIISGDADDVTRAAIMILNGNCR